MKAKNQTLLILILSFAVTVQAQVRTKAINANISTASIVNQSTTDPVIKNLFKSEIQSKRKNATLALTAKRASITADNGLKNKVLKTVNCTAGKLLDSLGTVVNTITDLTLKGTIDARDFKTMRDYMAALITIDMRDVKIVAYSGTQGSNKDFKTYNYPADEIPYDAFYEKEEITNIILPNGIKSIGIDAFAFCFKLKSVTIPSSVTSIGVGAFFGDSALLPVFIPNGVLSIGHSAFVDCNLNKVTIPSSVVYIGVVPFKGIRDSIIVDAQNPNYTSVDGVLYNKDKSRIIECPISKSNNFTIPSTVSVIDTGAFMDCNDLISITIPTSVTSIYYRAFSNCTNLSSISIPSSVKKIGTTVFSKCRSLKSISAYSSTPVVLPPDVPTKETEESDSISFSFYGVNKKTCTLYVPVGAKTAYQNAAIWKDFKNIQETLTSAFTLSSNTASFIKEGGEIKIDVTAIDTTNWTTLSSDETWLTVSPANGQGKGTITLTATDNSTSAVRTATVTVTATDLTTQTITLTQASDVVPALATSVKSLTIGTTDKSVATFNVTSNIVWTVASDQNWLTIDATEGQGDALVTLTAAANLATTSRKATITLLGTGVASQTITVMQSAFVPVFTISSKKINIDAAANSKATFSIISNGSWRIANYNKWFSVSPVSGNGNATITVTAQADTTSANRSAMISIIQSGFATKLLTVTQTIIPSTLDVSMTKHEIGIDSNIDTVLVTSNSAWVAFSDQPWLTVSATSGINNGTFLLTATTNNTGISRKANVTVTVGAITKTIIISQLAFPTDIETTESQVVTIFPNPVTDILYIKNFNGKATASIYTLGGKVVLSQSLNCNYINISELINGIYIIRIEQNDKVSMLKFVKK